MVTDKDRDSAHIVVRMVGCEFSVLLHQKIGIKEVEEKIAQMFSKTAEQARKESADSAVRYCKEVFGIEGLNTLRAAILSPLQNVGTCASLPTERNKLEIAKNALLFIFNEESAKEDWDGIIRNTALAALKDIQE